MTRLDAEEYARLLRTAQPKLWTLAAAILGDRTLAEDVVQDAAVTGLRRLDDFESGTNFLGWISQIVRFTALNYLKTRKRRRIVALDVHQDIEQESGETTKSPVTPDGQLLPDQQAFGDQVARAIEQLDDVRRSCFLLRVVHNLDYKEIAEMMDLPPGTAMSHVHRAKSTLRKMLGSRETGEMDE